MIAKTLFLVKLMSSHRIVSSELEIYRNHSMLDVQSAIFQVVRFKVAGECKTNI